MKDADKNRDPQRAYRRAKADAACAVRKLVAWAEELGCKGYARGLEKCGDEIAELAAKLEEKAVKA